MLLQLDFSEIANSYQRSTIPKTRIFCGTEELAYHYLQGAALFPHYVGKYHADLTQHSKHIVLQQFMSSRCSLCSVIAFGMVIMHILVILSK